MFIIKEPLQPFHESKWHKMNNTDKIKVIIYTLSIPIKILASILFIPCAVLDIAMEVNLGDDDYKKHVRINKEILCEFWK